MTDRDLRRRCQRVVAGLDIAAPLDVRALCRQVASRRGRPIQLVPMDAGPGLSGLWLATPTTDYIAYEASTSPLHRDHIILHELGHLLCNHAAAELVAGDYGHLLPSVDAGVVRSVLGRATHADDQEREAELIAALIHQRARRGAQTAGRDAVDVAPAVHRLETVLQGHVDWTSDH